MVDALVITRATVVFSIEHQALEPIGSAHDSKRVNVERALAADLESGIN